MVFCLSVFFLTRFQYVDQCYISVHCTVLVYIHVHVHVSCIYMYVYRYCMCICACVDIHVQYTTCTLCIYICTCKCIHMNVHVHVHVPSLPPSLYQLDAYDLLSKEPPTTVMADNQCRELLGTCTVYRVHVHVMHVHACTYIYR